MSEKPISNIKGGNNYNEVLSELSVHKNKPGGLKDASSELLNAICQRWQNCPSFEQCKAHGFLDLCCCKIVATNKIEWKPDTLNAAARKRHERDFNRAWAYACQQTKGNAQRQGIALKHLLQFHFVDFEIDLMSEVRKIVKQLNELDDE